MHENQLEILTTAMMPVLTFSLQYYEDLLVDLKRQQMSGKLVFNGANEEQWHIFFHLGRIIYANGGEHHIRRFSRQLKAHCPSFQWKDTGSVILDKISLDIIQVLGWDYECLRVWHSQQLITREQVHQIASHIAIEVLFDVMQEGAKSYDIIPYEQDIQSNYISLNDPIRLIQVAQQLLRKWNPSYPEKLTYTPNYVPIIAAPTALLQNTSSAVYKSLTHLLNGENTLRDLATIRKHSVNDITKSLLPYMQSDWVALKQVPDLPIPAISALITSSLNLSRIRFRYASIVDNSNAALIACVDDSEFVCLTMEKIFTSQGYRFTSIQDSLRAIPKLLAFKPDLIFLDLVMPNTNGYEICSHLRQLSLFKRTPIIILTGNDGIVDRVRAKMIGATDFLSKPIDSQTVLAVTDKYLNAAKFQD